MLLLLGCSSPVSAIPSPSWISSCLKGFLPRRPTGSHRLHQVATERFSRRTSGRTQPCWHSDCRHLPPELRENQLLLFGVTSSVQSFSCVRPFATPWTATHQASLFFTISQSLLKLMSTESVMPSNHLILCHPLFLPPSIFPSIRIFVNVSVLSIRWPKYWSPSISPSKEYLGLISFRMNWLDLLAVQGTLKSRLQHHSSKASILRHSAFFTVQLAHPYMTTGKIYSLD